MAELGSYKVREQPDQIYAVHDGFNLMADMYLPERDEPSPVVVGFPGGAFRRSSRKPLAQWGRLLASHGFAFMAAEYRANENPEPTFPGAIQDGMAAVRFARGQAGQFGLDPSRVGVFGTSAGATVASMVNLAASDPVFSGAYLDDPHAEEAVDSCAFAGIYGVYDMPALWRDVLSDNEPSGRGTPRNFLGAELPDAPRLYLDASAIHRVTYEAVRGKSYFVAYGTHDLAVNPRSQSEPFVTALTQARAQVVSYRVIGAGHFWANSEPHSEVGSASAYVAPRLLRFLSTSPLAARR